MRLDTPVQFVALSPISEFCPGGGCHRAFAASLPDKPHVWLSHGQYGLPRPLVFGDELCFKLQCCAMTKPEMRAIKTDDFSDPEWKSFKQQLRDIYKGLKTLFWLGVLGFLGWGGWLALDKSGWRSHNKDTDILVDDRWVVGEYRNCNATVNGDGTIAGLDCSSDPTQRSDRFHTMPTRFWGQVERTEFIPRASGDRPMWLWRCQRKTESVTCWAVN